MSRNYLDIPHREAFFELDDYDLFYRAFGRGDTVLLGLHGGPGSHSGVISPLARHGSDEVTVYLYDQFGAGRSDRPAAGDFDRYTVEHYREEVEAVRRAIGAESIVLYGASWGGMLAQEYAFEYPERVSKLILLSTLHDAHEAIEAMRASRRTLLTEEELETVRTCEDAHEFDDEDYTDLIDTVYDEHLIRVDRPIWWRKGEINTDIYGLMWGPNEFVLAETARLHDWSTKSRLPDLDIPTLVIVGEHDEIGPAISGDIADRLPNARLAVVEGASHAVMWDAPEEHYDLIEEFL